MINIPEEEIFNTEDMEWMVNKGLEFEIIDCIAKALVIHPIRFADIKILIDSCDGKITTNEIEQFARTRSLILHFMENEDGGDEQISENSQY